MKVYLDNAATTPLDPRVVEAMMPFYTDYFGNASSIHQYGREVRSAIEKARRTVAELIGAAPSEVFFNSGGTETDNTVIRNAIAAYDIKHAITSPIEHHAVLHTLEHLADQGLIELHFVELDDRGMVDYQHLEKLLKIHENAFVSLMYANNEIGNITDIEKVAGLCMENKAFFHSDTVQALGHLSLNVSDLNVQAIAGSAHKFHGPKGVGMMYVSGDKPIRPMMLGGGQERNMRGGTENAAGIIGLARALELAYEEKESSQQTIRALKEYTMAQLKAKLKNICFNGASADFDHSLNKVLSIGIPNVEDNDMLLFNLDINGIAVSGGSACASGTSIGSHVLDTLQLPPNTGTLRISFSKFNKQAEIDYLIDKLVEILK